MVGWYTDWRGRRPDGINGLSIWQTMRHIGVLCIFGNPYSLEGFTQQGINSHTSLNLTGLSVSVYFNINNSIVVFNKWVVGSSFYL